MGDAGFRGVPTEYGRASNAESLTSMRTWRTVSQLYKKKTR
jgi:hypothetical protein